MSEPRDNFIFHLVRLPAAAASALVRLYQLTISPALSAINLGGGCRFTPTCSHYARLALQERGLVIGLALTFRRLAKCAPWHPGGLDPVPARRPVCTRISSSPVSPYVTRHPPLS